MRRGFEWTWTKAAWLVWGAVLLVVAVHGFYHPQTHTVYPVYALASRLWWAGENIYVPTIEHYRYSPLFAVAMTPLALLPDCWGVALWKVLNCLIYAAALGVWARRVLPVALSRTELAWMFLLALPLSLHSMYIGQANLLMIAALLFGLAAAAKERWNLAAGFLAAATLVKGYPLALALVLMALYPRRFGLRYLAALALGLLLPFLTHRPTVVAGQYAAWLSHIQDSTGIMRERQRAVDYLFRIWDYPLSQLRFAALELLGGAAVLGLAWFQRWRSGDPRELFTRIGLLFSVWVALVGPATESCTYVVMAPAIAWALVDAFQRRTWTVTKVWLVASLLLMGPLVTDLFGPTIRNYANEHGSQPIGALLFLGYLLAQTWRRYPENIAGQAKPVQVSLPTAA
jgi:hypothetical protein